MKLNAPLFVALMFCLLSLNGNAQTNGQKQPLALVEYDENVNAPLTAGEKLQLKEVYGDKLQEYILSKPHRLKAIKNIFRNRVEIIELSDPKDQKDCELLSEVSLFNYYVKDLKRELVFNKNTFNPFKYNFNFYSRGSHMYRVDNTNYFILIKSQHN